MQHALVVRGMSPRTQEAYLAAVKGLAQHYHQRPETLSAQQVEGYLRHLIEQRPLAPNSVRSAVFGLRFFYTVTLKRPAFALPLPKGVKKLPEVLSREEVARLLASTTTLRERALLMATYGGGLRVSEVVHLRVSDIDAQRDLIRVEQGKGRKDRYTLLGPRLLAELRHYWQGHRPAQPWLFPQRRQAVPPGSHHRPEAVLCGQAPRRDHQGGRHPCSAPQFCHPPAGSGHGFAHAATALGP
jgi:site-specific recombinase XerD